VDPEVRRQAEETVKRCQEALANFDEEREVLDQRMADIKAEDRKIEERLKQIKKRKDAIRDAQKSRVTLEGRLSMCFFSRRVWPIIDREASYRKVERSIDVSEEPAERRVEEEEIE
jgi:hypothetical protein